jgi:hypothetical protein
MSSFSSTSSGESSSKEAVPEGADPAASTNNANDDYFGRMKTECRAFLHTLKSMLIIPRMNRSSLMNDAIEWEHDAFLLLCCAFFFF